MQIGEKKVVRIIPDPHLRFGFAHEIDLCCCYSTGCAIGTSRARLCAAEYAHKSLCCERHFLLSSAQPVQTFKTVVEKQTIFS